MKKLITITAFTLASLQAFSGTSCNFNVWGDYVCNGTGPDVGYRSSTTRNVWGDDRFSDNQGRNITCSHNVWGDYVCN